jgi:cytidyltransferase-like protein
MIKKKNKIVYVDMCADIFHHGHVKYLKACKELSDVLIVGIHSDDVIESYKRQPIMNMEDRIAVVDACRYVDKVIPNAPITVTEDYIKTHNIDIVCTTDNRTKEETELMYSAVIKLDKLHILPHTNIISTTEIIARCKKS